VLALTVTLCRRRQGFGETAVLGYARTMATIRVKSSHIAIDGDGDALLNWLGR